MMSNYSMALSNARILVLGGSSGIGFCVAEQALAQGASVTISSSNSSRLETAVQRLQASIPAAVDRLQGEVCSLGDLESIRPNLLTLLESVTKTGLLDHVVFTAGDPISIKPVGDLSIETIQRMGNVRFYGPMLLGGLATKYLKASHRSSITLTSGSMVHRPLQNWTATAAYGSGTEGVMRGLAVDLAPIRVNVVSPGAILTEMFDSIPEERKDGVLANFKKASLTNSVGTPEEASEAYLYLMRCSFATGTAIPVDGGRLLK
jgi:NAD(P)-dependent dehydrogenase (short-subunit alcohol dehydrogenase family)